MKIFLIGFMGAGKSYLGKLWANDHKIPFYDLDSLIEEEERITIEEIFSTYGEDYFREKEAAALRNTDKLENAIIACGGGTACYFDNMQWMNKNGTTVFLNETEENIYKHLRNDKKVRPLIIEQDEGGIQSFIKNKLAARISHYNESQVILPSHQLNEDGFVFVKKYISTISK